MDPYLGQVVAALLLIIVFGVMFNLYKEAKKNDYHNFIKTKVGSNEQIGNYCIISLDNGQTWYYMQHADVGYKNLRLVEPEFLEKILAWEAIASSVQCGGLDITKEKDRSTLKKAGFVIASKEEKSND